MSGRRGFIQETSVVPEPAEDLLTGGHVDTPEVLGKALDTQGVVLASGFVLECMEPINCPELDLLELGEGLRVVDKGTRPVHDKAICMLICGESSIAHLHNFPHRAAPVH